MATATMPNWASLKDRGGPWPEGLYIVHPEGDLSRLEFADSFAPDHIPPPPERIAALFRDEAVRKLVMETGSESIRMFNPWRGGWRICVEGLGEYQGETRDDALFNAWVAVLDARDAAR